MNACCDVVLFDLGGVLVELVGVPRMLEWTGGRMSEEELWRRWTHSPAVERFETDRVPPREFAQELMAEFGIGVSVEQFLGEFSVWPRGPFVGAAKLLEELAGRVRLACLSNISRMHWERFSAEMGLARYFSERFASFMTGLMKPQPQAYRNAIERLGVSPQRILFLDDNRINVVAAAQAGINAHVARSPDEARAILASEGVL